MGCSRGAEAEEGSRVRASCAPASSGSGAGRRLAEQMVAPERELRDTRCSLSGAGPTAAPSTSAASVEGPVVVVPTPTDPAAPPLSSQLAACTITLLASGSDIGGREVYP